MFGTIEGFNQAPPADVGQALRVCAPIDGWVTEVTQARPFASIEELADFCDRTARNWDTAQVLTAIASHDKLGVAPKGTDANSAHSRKEQASMGHLEQDTQQRMVALQDEYREKFGHIFLIRAAGRSAAEILSALEYRLTRSPAEEAATTSTQLREIAMLRLAQLFTTSAR